MKKREEKEIFRRKVVQSRIKKKTKVVPLEVFRARIISSLNKFTVSNAGELLLFILSDYTFFNVDEEYVSVFVDELFTKIVYEKVSCFSFFFSFFFYLTLSFSFLV
jgi:hypothetical protein